jgi:hypothetical protein
MSYILERIGVMRKLILTILILLVTMPVVNSAHRPAEEIIARWEAYEKSKREYNSPQKMKERYEQIRKEAQAEIEKMKKEAIVFKGSKYNYPGGKMLLLKDGELRTTDELNYLKGLAKGVDVNKLKGKIYKDGPIPKEEVAAVQVAIWYDKVAIEPISKKQFEQVKELLTVKDIGTYDKLLSKLYKGIGLIRSEELNYILDSLRFKKFRDISFLIEK